MYKILISAFIIVLVGTVFAGCSRLRVETDFDKGIDFKGAKSFAVSRTGPQPDEGGIYTSDIVHRRIAEAIRDDFRRKGLREVDENRADLLIGFRTTVADKVDVRPTEVFATYGYPPGWYSGAWAPQVDVYRYTQGSLVIDIFDHSSKKLAWRGIGESVISRNSSSPKQIKSAVQQILQDFPPSKAEDAS